MPNEDKEKRDQLLKLVRDAVLKDKELRDQFNIGDKFRFIRDRLNALQSRVEENVAELIKQVEARSDNIHPDEQLLYVYLFNVQGTILKTWTKMLNPAVFYEYSVNRPIYDDQTLVEGMIRAKSNRAQHGYLTFAVKKENIIPVAVENAPKDSLGNPQVRVKEGALKSERFISFTHNDQEYVLTEEGEIVKKKV